MDSLWSWYYPIKLFVMCGSLKLDLVSIGKRLHKNG